MVEKHAGNQQEQHLEKHRGDDGLKRTPQYVVAIGASAGGLQPIKVLLSKADLNDNLAYVVIQHLSKHHDSCLVELLSAKTTLKVVEATDGQMIEGNTVYVISPKSDLKVYKGVLHHVAKPVDAMVTYTINLFLESLAEDYQSGAISIILSGAGDDGSLGVKAIKSRGGLVIAQNPDQADFPSMPSCAIATNAVDIVTNVETMVTKIVHYIDNPVIKASRFQKMLQPTDMIFQIIEYICQKSQFDVSQYKLPSIVRRIERRLGILGLDSYHEYFKYLLKKPAEPTQFVNEMFIGVTEFFRDIEVFEYLEAEVIPKVIEELVGTELRVWIAGCSSGEEAYSMAILIDEALQKRSTNIQAKIFATDVDTTSLEAASLGEYRRDAVKNISSDRIERYFNFDTNKMMVSAQLRKMIVFAEHNVLSDPPFSRIDLAICRNLLIYLKPSAQQHVLSVLNFSLLNNRYLVLGNAESLGDVASQFSVMNDKCKVFRKIGENKVSESFLLPDKSRIPASLSVVRDRHRSGSFDKSKLSRPSGLDTVIANISDLIIQEYAPDALLIDQNGDVLHVYGNVDKYTKKLKPGRFSSNVRDFVNEPLKIAISTGILHATTNAEDVVYKNVPIANHDEAPSYISLTFRYYFFEEFSDLMPLMMILFGSSQEKPLHGLAGATNQYDRQEGVVDFDLIAQSRERIAELEAQLTRKQEYLHAIFEELESTNEELKSSNEELLASNEEMQSTNEELQSVNEELHTVNSEYQSKINEITRINIDMDNIMRSIQIGVIMLDDAMIIRRFTESVKRDFNLMETDLGRPFHHISHNMEYENILKDVAEVLDKHEVIQKDVRSAEGRILSVKILPYISNPHSFNGCVITLEDKTETNQLRGRLSSSNSIVKSRSGSVLFLSNVKIKILVIDDNAADLAAVERMLLDPRLRLRYDVHLAADTDIALSLLQLNTFDICLIDFFLGVDDAVGFIRKNLELENLPPFVLLSGNVNPVFSTELIELGVYDAIDKGELSPNLLERVISYTLHQSRMEKNLNTDKS